MVVADVIDELEFGTSVGVVADEPYAGANHLRDGTLIFSGQAIE